MSGLIVTLIVLASLMAYATAAGFIGTRFHAWRTAACEQCSRPEREWSCYSDHNTAAAFAGAAWPFIAPIVVGVWGATRDKRADRLVSEIDRLERELGMNR